MANDKSNKGEIVRRSKDGRLVAVESYSPRSSISANVLATSTIASRSAKIAYARDLASDAKDLSGYIIAKSFGGKRK